MLDIYRSINNRRLFGRRFVPLHKQTQKLLYGVSDIKVCSGPFKGLLYINEIVWGPITPKWLGSYETELNDIIEEIVSRGYKTIIDIGCAEGYYAVGLAFRCEGARVYAYDTDVISRRQTKRLARLNQLEKRVVVARYCSGNEIEKRATVDTLVVCDIEGFERLLLNPSECPSLLNTDILVEIHEAKWTPSTLELLQKRFHRSHIVEEVSSTDRERWIQQTMVEALLTISKEHLREATNEHRTNGQKWLWMKVKTLVDEASSKLCDV